MKVYSCYLKLFCWRCGWFLVLHLFKTLLTEDLVTVNENITIILNIHSRSWFDDYLDMQFLPIPFGIFNQFFHRHVLSPNILSCEVYHDVKRVITIFGNLHGLRTMRPSQTSRRRKYGNNRKAKSNCNRMK